MRNRKTTNHGRMKEKTFIEEKCDMRNHRTANERRTKGKPSSAEE
jgi:hypothetical protein